jgi:hypothetical protein
VISELFVRQVTSKEHMQVLNMYVFESSYTDLLQAPLCLEFCSSTAEAQLVGIVL